VKARKIRKLDPDAALIDAACRILTVRLDEVDSFTAAVTDPGDERALHDMRIAFKRLRYVLEVTRPCFGEPADDAIASAKRFQDLLGEIHDCDVMVPMVEAHIERLRGEDLMAVRARSDGAATPDAKAIRSIPNRRRYRGLETAATYFRARRELLYGRLMKDLGGKRWMGFKDRVTTMARASA
jgi:CHAD domain-containing protein